MIFGHLNDRTTYASLAEKLPVLRRALAWIQSEGKDKDPGKYPLESDMYADVQSTATQARENGRFESHEKFVDVQFCYEGGEVIEYAPASTLEPLTEYNPDKDVRHYRVPSAPQTALRLIAGSFAVFFPGDAHLPKVSNGLHANVRKVVVKIPIEQLV